MADKEIATVQLSKLVFKLLWPFVYIIYIAITLIIGYCK